MKNKRLSKIILLCALCASVQCAFSAQSFKNNLLKADLNKNALGNLKLTLYTNTPYKDSIIVNKKNDFEYVVLMPETSNSVVDKPTLNTVKDLVKKIDIKTQQYDNQLKGYTKITILTVKPIEINAEVKASNNTVQLSENDYNELIAQASQQKTTTLTQVVVPTKKSQITKQIKQPVMINAAPIAKPSVKSEKKQKDEIKEVKKETFKQGTEIEAAPKTEKISETVKLQKKAINKTSLKQKTKHKPIQTTIIPETVAPNATVEQKEIKPNVEITEPIKPQQSNTVAPVIVPASTVTSTTIQTANPIKTPVLGRLQKYKKLIKTNLYTITGAMAALFILLLLIARKNRQNHNKQKEIFASHLADKPNQVTDYTDKITDDMDWKEKFQTYVDASQSQDEQEIEIQEQFEAHPDIDNLFGSDADEEHIIETKDDFASQTIEQFEDTVVAEDSAVFQELASQNEEEVFSTTDDLDALFDEEEETTISQSAVNFINEEPSQNLIEEEEDELIKAEFSIDGETGFYLVDVDDTTSLVGHIDEEIFVIKRFEQKVRGPIKVRLDEKTETKSNYMTRVGSFRGLVEVTPQKMNLLIEL